MCSSCGGAKAALRNPGGSPRYPIVFGELVDGAAAQPATFLADHEHAKTGDYKYISGDGIEAAIEAGIVRIGYTQPARPARAPAPPPAHEWFVQVARNKWHGFKTETAARRYAKTRGTDVLTAAQVLEARKAAGA